MERKEKAAAVAAALAAAYPDPRCALDYAKDYELMVAVRLSAQCTDARVNLVTPALFAAFPTLEALAGADIAQVEELVRTCGFYKHKARDIVLACQMLLTDYGGEGAKHHGGSCSACRGWAGKPPICCWGICTTCLGRWYATPTASGFPTAWAWPRGRSRRRWSGSSGKFSRRRAAATSVTGLSSTVGQCAPPGNPSAKTAPWRLGVHI